MCVHTYTIYVLSAHGEYQNKRDVRVRVLAPQKRTRMRVFVVVCVYCLRSGVCVLDAILVTRRRDAFWCYDWGGNELNVLAWKNAMRLHNAFCCCWCVDWIFKVYLCEAPRRKCFVVSYTAMAFTQPATVSIARTSSRHACHTKCHVSCARSNCFRRGSQRQRVCL